MTESSIEKKLTENLPIFVLIFSILGTLYFSIGMPYFNGKNQIHHIEDIIDEKIIETVFLDRSYKTTSQPYTTIMEVKSDKGSHYRVSFLSNETDVLSIEKIVDKQYKIIYEAPIFPYSIKK